MMRKRFFVSLLFILALSANAQKKSIALNYSYLTDIHNSGIGVNAKFNVWDKLKVAPDFTYYFKRNMTQFFNGNINLGYSIGCLPDETLSIIPYVGIGIHHIYINGNVYEPGGGTMPGGNNPYPPTWIKIKDNRTELVANFGVDMEYNITKCIFINVGTKYMLGIGDSSGKDYLDQFVINSGIGFRF